jgi:Nucleotidyl transferase of unknown function (DUF2204)
MQMNNGNNGLVFYQRVMRLLLENGVQFLVGGAYAFRYYTGLVRDTKDIDLMVRPVDVATVLAICQRAGYEAGYAFSHWLAKVRSREGLIDIIFRSGNGLCEVDDEWFVAAPRAEVLGIQTALVQPEEMVWQKAYVMERERFDGADVAHLLFHCGKTISWEKLLVRFGPDWRVFFSHLILFGFIYPGHRSVIPKYVLSDLITRLAEEEEAGSGDRICNGTLLSKTQYLDDIRAGGFWDARLSERCKISPEELLIWTNAPVEPP